VATRYAARVFWAAAFFNVAVGATGLLAPAVTAALLGIAPPENPIFVVLASWLILALGFGYGLTARNPAGNRDLMLLGAVGKLFVLPIMILAWLRGWAGAAAIGPAAGDFVFALLFFDVRRRTPAPR
jgi:hypothetical protein